jgi:hypothetical protein
MFLCTNRDSPTFGLIKTCADKGNVHRKCNTVSSWLFRQWLRDDSYFMFGVDLPHSGVQGASQRCPLVSG